MVAIIVINLLCQIIFKIFTLVIDPLALFLGLLLLPKARRQSTQQRLTVEEAVSIYLTYPATPFLGDI